MKNTALTLSFALVTASLGAQQMSNEVVRNNQPYLVISTATSAATGLNYNWDPVNPPEYSAGTLGAPVGVPANTWSFRVLPSESNYRFQTRKVAGFVFLVRLSAETGTSWANGYEPECNLMGTVVRPQSPVPAWDPNWNNVLVSVPEMPVPAASQLFTVTRTLAAVVNTPVIPNQSEHIAVAMKFRGGESKWVNGAHGFVASWYDGPTAFNTMGFYYPSTMTYVRATDPFFLLWSSYLEDEPTIALHSDWGQRRYSTTNPLNPPLLGHSLGTYYSDIRLNAGQLGISVRAVNQPNGFALTLFNFGPPLQIGFPVLGQTIELNIADPFLSLFSGIANIGLFQLDGNGEVDGLKFNIPANAAFLGTFMGFEALVADQFFAIAGSTGSAFIKN